MVRAGAVEGKGAPHPGRVQPILWLPEPLAAEGKGAQHLGRVEYLKTGTTLKTGATQYRAVGSQSSIDGESTDTPVWGKPSVAGTQGVLSVHCQICLQCPVLPIAGLN